MSEARDVIAAKFYGAGWDYVGDDVKLGCRIRADSILSALKEAGYVVIHKDDGEAFEQHWMSYLGVTP